MFPIVYTKVNNYLQRMESSSYLIDVMDDDPGGENLKIRGNEPRDYHSGFV